MAGPTEEHSPPKENSVVFPPITRSHILNCSYHAWYSLYRAVSPKARLIPLTESFINYIRADGIVLPPDETSLGVSDDDSWTLSTSNGDSNSEKDGSDDEDEPYDPSREWPEVHAEVIAKIRELGGQVSPKLNWSAPRDAKWILPTNDMQCRTANDVYLLLKCSNFMNHDLDHAFDDCVVEPNQEQDPAATTSNQPPIPYHLVLRKYFNVNTSLEFRCFVRHRQLICLCQRDLTYYDFLSGMRNELLRVIQSFFDEKLRDTFPDPDFVFDVYVPPPHNRVWLIDINPFAPKTDPLLFSWQQILRIGQEVERNINDQINEVDEQVVRLKISAQNESSAAEISSISGEDDDEESDIEEVVSELPLFLLLSGGNPAGTNMNAAPFSAHKLPKDVVDASRSGPGGMSEFLTQWRDILEGRIQPDTGDSDDDN
ncbi:cell division cycle protein 123 [Trichophyton tonsurans CBS 112818]|uniref:Cell division cycle protein 123 n=2 Tax=Trichophyton TaxID=5550 RepID=F2PZZ1_TRIEC|nr:cell division cycle protein 123 [Trichophyton tonsurans CBS 112818]EGE07459.1 cell division cycle protein 123 [Trichophyton equinum CBS 127.97]